MSDDYNMFMENGQIHYAYFVNFPFDGGEFKLDICIKEASESIRSFLCNYLEEMADFLNSLAAKIVNEYKCIHNKKELIDNDS